MLPGLVYSLAGASEGIAMLKKLIGLVAVIVLGLSPVAAADSFLEGRYTLEIPEQWQVVRSTQEVSVFADEKGRNVVSAGFHPPYPGARSQLDSYLLLRMVNKKISEEVPDAAALQTAVKTIAGQPAMLTRFAGSNDGRPAQYLAASFWVNDTIFQILCRSDDAVSATRLETVFKPILDSISLAAPTAHDWAGKARLAWAQNRFKDAIEAYTRATELDAKNTEYLYQLAYAYSHNGNYEQAVGAITQAIALAPKNADYYAERAYSYIQMKNPQAALDDANQALALNSRNADFYAARGNAYALLGDYEAALADFQQCSLLKGDILNADFNLGQVYELLGRRDEALACYETVAAAADLPDEVKLKVRARVNGDWELYREWI
ncbi:MAG: tetratricopeptide repeat protein [Sporomusaceae bacterium]|nr:tetratricopeptide repeat protein [Sporomusaceae bacterium]